MPTPIRLVIQLLALLAACAAPSDPPRQDLDADAGTSPDGGAPIGLPLGDPISAPAETWTYVPFPEAACGNGSETGLGVNLKPGAKTLVIFLQGGGACWEYVACFVLKTAVHVEDVVQSGVVLAEAQDPKLGVLFSRTDPANPLRDAHFAYASYCTGDLHSGTNVQTYTALGDTRTVHHVGAKNLDAFLGRLVPTAAGVERVILAGVSAGGYGALLHWWRVREAFGPGVRVDVLDDSGLPVEMARDRFDAATQAWKPQWPPGCADCATGGFPRLLPHYAATVPAPARFALFGFRQDAVVSAFFGIPGATIQASLDAQRASAAPNQRFFLLDGTSHVVLDEPTRTTSTGVVARDWLREFLTDAPTWNHAGP